MSSMFSVIVMTSLCKRYLSQCLIFLAGFHPFFRLSSNWELLPYELCLLYLKPDFLIVKIEL